MPREQYLIDKPLAGETMQGQQATEPIAHTPDMTRYLIFASIVCLSILTAAVSIQFARQNGLLQLSWRDGGVLEESKDLKSWSTVPNAESPLVVQPSAKETFYRVTTPADTIIHNANIYTLDPTLERAQTLAITEGRITYVGDTSPEALQGPNTALIDANQNLVLPGFQDAHVHAVEAGINESYTLFPQFGSASEIRDSLEQAIEDQPGTSDDWIIAAGVNMVSLLETLESPIALIDRIIPTRPAVILDDLGHGAWANSAALQQIGVTQFSEDPPGGILDRDEDGRLTGIVFESVAQTLIDASQSPTPEALDFAYQSFLAAIDNFSRFGITTVSDAGGYWPRGHHTVWTRAEREGRLKVRANNALYVYPEKDFEQQITAIAQLRSNDPSKLVRFNQVKIYVDGIISQTTAALLAPYESQALPGLSTATGFTYFAPSVLNRYATRFEKLGFQLHFHATGDRGARLALDAIAHARRENGSRDQRHRITHLFMVAPSDVPRFRELEVFADFQLSPSSLTEENLADVSFLIGERTDRYLAAKPLLESGAELTLSSDFDADELSPFIKIEEVLSQPAPHTIPDVQTAVELMTIKPAKLLKQEASTGSLSVGKFADLIILDQNIYTIPHARISETTVLLTLLAGNEVYRDKNF